ncbi:hypothetical protein Tco_0483796 [Tanacetum coccineum]
MLNRHKNWLVHKQTACGKDFLNPFMVDNLPKIVGFSTHLASLVKSWLVQDQTVLALASAKANELTIPEQTATGKGTSNPLMAGSLPKTTKPTHFARECDNQRKSKIQEEGYMEFLEQGLGAELRKKEDSKIAQNQTQRYDGILSYENEVLQSVFMNKESELEKQPLYDRFVTADGMHVVPLSMTGNYMPSGPDIEVDYSQFTYGPKQTQPSESESQSSEFDTCESNISTEPSELVSEPVVNESNVECQLMLVMLLSLRSMNQIVKT